MLINISVTTRGTMLRKIERLNFESLNGTEFRRSIFRSIVPLVVTEMLISINFM